MKTDSPCHTVNAQSSGKLSNSIGRIGRESFLFAGSYLGILYIIRRQESKLQKREIHETIKWHK